VAALAWFAARRAGVVYGTAILAGLLFAVHPVHVEAVANVAGRAELLAAGLSLGAWLCHRGRHPLPAAVLYLLAILSKEGAVLAPVLFLLDDLRRRREGGTPLGARAHLGYAAALAVALALRAAALGGLRGAEDAVLLDNPAAFAPAPVRLATALWVVARDVGLVLWPARLVSDYSLDAIPLVRSVGDPRLLAGLVVAGAVVGLAVWGYRRSRPALLAASIFALFLLPAANLLFPVGTLLAERLLYLPSLGACLLAGHGLASLAHRGRAARAAALAAALALIGAGAARSAARVPDWRDNATLALRDVVRQPRSAKLQAGAGIAHHAAGRDGPAEAAYREALAIWPEYAQIHYDLALLLARRGAEEEAIVHLREAGRLAPGNPSPFHALAFVYETRGRTEEALAAYAAGAAADPRDLPFRFNHARALLAAGRRAEGLAVLDALAGADPGGLVGTLARALALETRGRDEEAAALYGEVAARPGVPEGIRERARERLASLRQGR
jgi:predicted Zn-dependent protease